MVNVKGVQEMLKRNRKWILRSLQVLIGLVLLISVVPAGAHLSGGYLHRNFVDEKKDINDYGEYLIINVIRPPKNNDTSS